MNFSLIENKLTKDIILSSVSEEQIFCFYIGSEVKSKKLFRSKLRRDKNPTCSLYRSKSGSLIYKDFASGQHFNCFGYVMALFNCNYQESLKIIANDFNIKSDPNINKNKGKIISKDFKIIEKEFSKIQIEAQDFTELELKWWKKFGISKETLEKFNVYSCKHVFLNGQVIAKSQQHCPIFGYYGDKLNGEELWRCYFPKRKEGRFIGNWPSRKIQGFEFLPKTGNILIITKSMKDCLALYSFGIPAIAPCSENLFVSDKILKNLKERFKHIVVFYDNDIPGVSNMRKIKKEYPDLNYYFIPRKYRCKDFSDAVEFLGKNKVKKILIENLNKLKQNGKENI